VLHIVQGRLDSASAKPTGIWMKNGREDTLNYTVKTLLVIGIDCGAKVLRIFSPYLGVDLTNRSKVMRKNDICDLKFF